MKKKPIDFRHFSEKYRNMKTEEERTALVDETLTYIRQINSEEEALDFLYQFSDSLDALRTEMLKDIETKKHHRLAS
jgi:hypothetical protein